jgi:hypothetical protein
MHRTVTGRGEESMQHPPFRAIVESLDTKVDALIAAPHYSYGAFPNHLPQRGVYLF